MKRLSIGYRVLLAILLGMATGLFFGPLTASFNPIGSAYTMLLQMAVLPYLAFSVMHGLGSITPEVGKKILRSGWLYWIILWGLIFLLISLLCGLIPTSLPPIVHSGQSTALESQFTQNFLENLIPENPFYDLLNNIVPAIAVFGLISGLALMHLKQKEPLIDALERITQAIEKILHWLGTLAPIGAYVYVSIAFGTIYFEDFSKLQLYIFPSIFCSVFVTFWILPALLAALTPLSYQEALQAFRFVCLLPFATGLSTAALPFLNAYLKRLAQKHETHDRFRETSQTILPIAYSFGQIGNALILFLISFLSYYYRYPLAQLEKILLSILAIPLSIGSSSGNVNSMFFLIQQLGFPQGASELFLEMKAFTIHFQVLMSIASVFTLTLLTLYAYYGLIQWKWNRFATRLAAPLLCFAVITVGLKSLIHPRDLYKTLFLNLKMSEAIANPIQPEILKDGKEGAPRTFANTIIPEVFKQIIATQVLKVGFSPNAIPYCYYNNQQELVGFDVAYAYELARDLGCRLQLIPFSFDQLAFDMNEGVFDIGMSSIIMNEERLVHMVFTYPYLADHIVLVVPRKRQNEFTPLEAAQKLKPLRLGAGGALVEVAKHHFPNATITDIETAEPLIQGELDAIVWAKTSATIWCLSHPEFIAIEYGNSLGKGYFGYPIRQHATDFGFFLNNWLALKENSGFKTKMENYWLHGISPKPREPRWSILEYIRRWDHEDPHRF